MSDYTPTPKLPDFFAPKPTSGALTYTPTTEEVRAEYADCTAGMYDAYAEFDRWLAEVKAQAWHEGLEAAELGIANPYRQGEGSENGASQSPVESNNLLNEATDVTE